MNSILFMEPKLQLAAHNHICCRLYIASIVTIATQSIVFIKNLVNWLLGNQSKIYVYLVLLL